MCDCCKRASYVICADVWKHGASFKFSLTFSRSAQPRTHTHTHIFSACFTSLFVSKPYKIHWCVVHSILILFFCTSLLLSSSSLSSLFSSYFSSFFPRPEYLAQLYIPYLLCALLFICTSVEYASQHRYYISLPMCGVSLILRNAPNNYKIRMASKRSRKVANACWKRSTLKWSSEKKLESILHYNTHTNVFLIIHREEKTRLFKHAHSSDPLLVCLGWAGNGIPAKISEAEIQNSQFDELSKSIFVVKNKNWKNSSRINVFTAKSMPIPLYICLGRPAILIICCVLVCKLLQLFVPNMNARTSYTAY